MTFCYILAWSFFVPFSFTRGLSGRSSCIITECARLLPDSRPPRPCWCLEPSPGMRSGSGPRGAARWGFPVGLPVSARSRHSGRSGSVRCAQARPSLVASGALLTSNHGRGAVPAAPEDLNLENGASSQGRWVGLLSHGVRPCCLLFVAL